MKQLIIRAFVLAVFCLNLFSGCDDETGKNLLKLDKDTITLNHKDATEKITVTSGAAWQLSGKPDWISITPAASDQVSEEITLVADENDTFEQRTATLIFTNGHISRKTYGYATEFAGSRRVYKIQRKRN